TRSEATRETALCGSGARVRSRHRRTAKRLRTNVAHGPLAAPEPALSLVEQPTPQPAAAGPRILIVEDDPGAAGFIREALELEGGAGWDIHVAPGGQQAIELASALPPEVVLLDVGLPDVDGAEVYRRLRANPVTARARVLFLTAFTSLDLHQHGIDGGVLLRKPFDVQALAGLVRTLLAA
ncbi:MAG TPA: response regulator, partial [Ktedonobacterales bacterium]